MPSTSSARHLLPLDYKLYPLDELGPTQLALAVFHPDWDDSRSTPAQLYKLFSRLRERARNPKLPPPIIQDAHDKLHLVDLSWELNKQAVSALDSDQLLAVPWHPDATDAIELQATRELWRRRERDARNGVTYQPEASEGGEIQSTSSNDAAGNAADAAPPPRPPIGTPSPPPPTFELIPPSSAAKPDIPAPAPAPVPAPAPAPAPAAAAEAPRPAPIQAARQAPRRSVTPLRSSPAPASRPASLPARPAAGTTTEPSAPAQLPQRPPQKALPPQPPRNAFVPSSLTSKHLHTLKIRNLPPALVAHSRDFRNIFPSSIVRPVGVYLLRPGRPSADGIPAAREGYAAWRDFDDRTAAMQVLVTLRLEGRWVPEVEMVDAAEVEWEWDDFPLKDQEELWAIHHGVEVPKRQPYNRVPPSSLSRATSKQPATRKPSPVPTRCQPPPTAAPAPAPIPAPAAVSAQTRQPTPRRSSSPRPAPERSPSVTPADFEPIPSRRPDRNHFFSHPTLTGPIEPKLFEKQSTEFALFQSTRPLPAAGNHLDYFAPAELPGLSGVQPMPKKRTLLLAFSNAKDRDYALTHVLSKRPEKSFANSVTGEQFKNGWEWRHMSPAFRAKWDASYEKARAQHLAKEASGNASASGTPTAEVQGAASVRGTKRPQGEVEQNGDVVEGGKQKTPRVSGPDSAVAEAASTPTATTSTTTVPADSSSLQAPIMESSRAQSVTPPLPAAATTPPLAVASATAVDDTPCFNPLTDDSDRPLPEGWHRYWSKSHGEWYYKNPQEEVTWFGPFDDADDDDAVDGEAMDLDGDDATSPPPPPPAVTSTSTSSADLGLAPANNRPPVSFSLARSASPSNTGAAQARSRSHTPQPPPRASIAPTLAARARSPIDIRGTGPETTSQPLRPPPGNAADALADRLAPPGVSPTMTNRVGRRMSSPDPIAIAGGLLDRLTSTSRGHSPAPAPPTGPVTKPKNWQQWQQANSASGPRKNPYLDSNGNINVNTNANASGASLTDRLRGPNRGSNVNAKQNGGASSTVKGGKTASVGGKNGVQVGSHVVQQSHSSQGQQGGKNARKQTGSGGGGGGAGGGGDDLLSRMGR